MCYMGRWDPESGYKHRAEDQPAEGPGGILGDSGFGGRRESQRLGQQLVSEGTAPTQDRVSVAGDLWDLSPAHVVAWLRLLLVDQQPLTPKGSCLTGGTDPKGQRCLPQKLWRSCSVPVLLWSRESW